MTTVQDLLNRAADLQGKFLELAAKHGTYTTKPLINLRPDTPLVVIRQAHGRSLRYLTAAEADEWADCIAKAIEIGLTSRDCTAFNFRSLFSGSA